MTSADPELVRRGFARCPAVIPPALVDELRAAIECLPPEAIHPGPYGKIFHNLWRRVPLFAEEIRRGRLASLAMELTGEPTLRLFQDLMISKPPGTSIALKWHQDFSYWPLDSARGLVLWIALDDADTQNGCLRYIPGSHHLGERRPADFVVGASQVVREDLPPLNAEEREADAVDMPVRAGDALAHDPLVWHMSPPNLSERPRRAWSITFIRAETRWAPTHAPHPFCHELSPRAGELPEGPLFPSFTRTIVG